MLARRGDYLSYAENTFLRFGSACGCIIIIISLFRVGLIGSFKLINANH